MTSPRRRPDSPVESVELKVTFKGDRSSLSKIKEAIPGAVWRDGALEVRLKGKRPLELADDAKTISDRVRGALQGVDQVTRRGARETRKNPKRL